MTFTQKDIDSARGVLTNTVAQFDALRQAVAAFRFEKRFGEGFERSLGFIQGITHRLDDLEKTLGDN